MNRLILEPTDFISQNLVHISGARAQHLRSVCNLMPGDPIKLGILNGPLGEGQVEERNLDSFKIRYLGDCEPSLVQASAVSIMLALPRPQMLKRIFQKAATFGVRQLALFRSERVEKSFFGSPVLKPEEIKKNLILGLEQGASTTLPEVVVFKSPREFSDWRAAGKFRNKFILSLNAKNNILHHSADGLNEASFLIGPEGGFIAKEEERFLDEGFIPIRVFNS